VTANSPSPPSAIVYRPEYKSYDFGPQHPLRPERLGAGLSLLEALGLWNPAAETIDADAATTEELALIHDDAYIRAVKEAGTGWFPGSELRRYGLGIPDNPAFPGMHEAAALVAGGTADAVRRIMRGQLLHAFAPAGGLHHAFPARAAGFCIYNDPALAAAIATREFGARVLYVDFDCHHGDGVQEIFYRDPSVLTVSFHESGEFLFPGTGSVVERGAEAGRGYAVNVPVMPYTDDRSWHDTIHAVLPPVAERFQPDLIISAHGADTHIWDPLTHLALTTASFAAQAQLVHDLARTHTNNRWLAVGSGGYDWRRVVPRSWAILWAEMTGRPLPADLPPTWCTEWDTEPLEPLPRTIHDGPDIAGALPARAESAEANRTIVAEVRRLHALDRG